MKKLLFIGAVLFVNTLAFAGDNSCNSSRSFRCSATYTLKNTAIVAGPSQEQPIVDLQAEAFDPTDCQAIVVLYTPVGKFIADYSQTENTLNAWLEFDGSATSFARSTPFSRNQSLNVTVPYPFKGDIQSVKFNCSLERD